MKRLLSALLMIALLVTLSTTASAESEKLSMQYVPRTQRGTLFYLDVSCDAPVSAAVFELNYDPSIAEFRDVYCDDENADAMGNADGSTIRIAYSHRASATGKLCRLSFKALKAGTVQFHLHITQAVDKELNYLSDFPDCTLEIKLGKDDVVSPDTVTRQKTSGSSEKSSSTDTAQKQSYSGSKSETVALEDVEAEKPAPTEKQQIDYSGMTKWNWFELGAASALFAALTAFAGFSVIRKLRKKRALKADDEDVPESGEEEEIPPDGNDNSK